MAFTSATFLDQLRRMKNQTQLGGRPLSAQETAGAYSGWAAGASDRLARSRGLDIQGEAATTQKEQFAQNLAFLKDQDKTQREIAEKAAERDRINQGIQAVGTGAIVYGAGKQANWWGGKAAPVAGEKVSGQAAGGQAALTTGAVSEAAPAATETAPMLIGGTTGGASAATPVATEAAPVLIGGETGGGVAGGAEVAGGSEVAGSASFGTYVGSIAYAIAIQQLIQNGPGWLNAAMGGEELPNDVSQNINILKNPENIRTSEESKNLWSKASPAFDLNDYELAQYRKTAMLQDQAIYNMVQERLKSGELEALVNTRWGEANGVTKENFALLKARLEQDQNIKSWIL